MHLRPRPTNGEQLTVRLAEVEADEEKNNADDDEKEADEVELRHVLAQRLALARVQVEREEEHSGRDASSRPARRESRGWRKMTRCEQIDPEAPAPRDLVRECLGSGVSSHAWFRDTPNSSLLRLEGQALRQCPYNRNKQRVSNSTSPLTMSRP
jgi:hypothetical protein